MQQSQQLSKHIAFGESLELLPFLSEDSRRASQLTSIPAELYAVVVHQGHSSHSGHYYAYVKQSNPTGRRKWFKMNDAIVTEVGGHFLSCVSFIAPGFSFFRVGFDMRVVGPVLVCVLFTLSHCYSIGGFQIHCGAR